MKGKRFTEEQIVGVLREHQAGATAREVCRRHGMSRRRACRPVGLSRSVAQYRRRERDEEALRARLSNPTTPNW